MVDMLRRTPQRAHRGVVASTEASDLAPLSRGPVARLVALAVAAGVRESTARFRQGFGASEQIHGFGLVLGAVDDHRVSPHLAAHRHHCRLSPRKVAFYNGL